MASSSGGGESGSSDADRHGQPDVPTTGGPAGAGEETVDGSSGLHTVSRPWSADPLTPPHPPTEVASTHPPTEVASPHPPTEAASPPETEGASHYLPAAGATVSAAAPAGIVRQGPGVPVSPSAGQVSPSAEQVWRTGQLSAPLRRRRRLRRISSSALTVVLLVAAGVVLYLRFHHGPLQVTGVAITRQVTNGCAVDVTGRITTNGSAGTVSYQWLLRPQSEAPQPMSQSVVAGQGAVYVTVAVQGQGQGSAARDVTLQVLGPGTGTASVHVSLSC
jgi:hypothetical protein